MNEFFQIPFHAIPHLALDRMKSFHCLRLCRLLLSRFFDGLQGFGEKCRGGFRNWSRNFVDLILGKLQLKFLILRMKSKIDTKNFLLMFRKFFLGFHTQKTCWSFAYFGAYWLDHKIFKKIKRFGRKGSDFHKNNFGVFWDSDLLRKVNAWNSEEG